MAKMKHSDKTIYTFNNNGYVGNSVIKSVFDLSEEDIYRAVWTEVEELHRRLLLKNINYKDLKGALIPNQDKDKCEICFVIDTEKVPSSFYGLYVFERLIPLLDKESTYSILHGNYLLFDDNERTEMVLKYALLENLCKFNDSKFYYCEQYYLIYINRLSKKQRDSIVNGLKDYEWFTGYIDTTYSSYFKTFISNTLPQLVIKCKGIVIGPHPEDCKDEENVNMIGYPFTDSGFEYVSINCMSYAPFLSYKIEDNLANEEDVGFSFNALFPKFDSYEKISLQIADPKWEKYLVDKENGKGVILEKIGYDNDDKERFISVVYRKICSNYLYNIRIDEQHDALLFNVCVEMKTINGNIRKTTIGLKYLPESGEMHVVTIT